MCIILPDHWYPCNPKVDLCLDYHYGGVAKYFNLMLMVLKRIMQTQIHVHLTSTLHKEHFCNKIIIKDFNFVGFGRTPLVRVCLFAGKKSHAIGTANLPSFG